MDLRTYMLAIRKSWAIVLLAVILGVAAGIGLYVRTPPTYVSTVEFYVSTPLNDGTSAQSAGQFAESRVNSYIPLLSSEELANRVIKSTGVSLSATQLSGKITATAELNTVLVTATVSDTSSARSLLIAQGVADSFGPMVDDLDNQGRENAIVVINVVSGPTANPNAVAPDLKKYAGLGLGIGLVLGVMIAVLRELLDTSVRTEAVAQRLVGAPVIGTIEHDSDTRRSRLIVGEEATSIRAESYRQLRTNLQFVAIAHSARVLMVTSSVPLEGKSTTAVNLALSFVELGERVLLIEADLRRPKISDYLDVEREVGLTNLLVGQVELDDVVQPWGNDGLHVLASGSVPPNPSELLGSPKMGEIIAQLRPQFDRIVIDTPPVLPVTDAVVASSLTDGVVFIVRHGRTTRSQVATAAGSLHAVDANVLGTVLNMKKTNRSERRRYGGGTYYGSTAGAAVTLGGNLRKGPGEPS